mgnify:CR=1 FL=1
MIQKTKVKKMFNSNKVQITKDALNMIDDDFKRHIERMVNRCKANNVKRITPEAMWMALGNYDMEKI